VDPARQKLIDRARELNTQNLSVAETKERIWEACSEWLIEAKIDVDRLLRHEDWDIRWNALEIVWHGIGATDGIEQSIEIFLHDPDGDVRAQAALALYEAARGTPKEARVREVFGAVIDDSEAPEYVRERAARHLRLLNELLT
jgi:hypothetical protein